MPVHPAAPADVTELVAAYRQTLTSFADVADGLRGVDPQRHAGPAAHRQRLGDGLHEGAVRADVGEVDEARRVHG